MIILAPKMTKRNQFVFVPLTSNEKLFNSFRSQGMLKIESLTQSKDVDNNAPFVNLSARDKVSAVTMGLDMARYLDALQSRLTEKAEPTEKAEHAE